jgi:sugar/nucleoside kinase (ribokinase family)
VAVLPVSEASEASGSTGTVFVLPSADASRSFLSFFQSERFEVSASLRRSIAQSRLVIIDGYMWELPNAAAAITEIVAVARSSGVQVALTAGDPGVVARNRASIVKVLMAAGRDMMYFSNREEACELLGQGRTCDAESAASGLGSLVSVAVVTDGGKGSYVSCMGQVHAIPPVDPAMGGEVVDTCGAGDAYAAGFAYALTMGHDAATAGGFASSTASRVIARHGAQLLEEEAQGLVGLLPKHTAFSAALSRSIRA